MYENGKGWGNGLDMYALEMEFLNFIVLFPQIAGAWMLSALM